MKLALIAVALNAAAAASAADIADKEAAMSKLRGAVIVASTDLSCTADSDCVSGEFCKFNLANCGNQGPGVCTTIVKPGTPCPMNINEVCGCDGKTYSNECVADAASASVKHYGKCENAQCDGDGDCSPFDYCLFDPGHCGKSGQPGLCVEVPPPNSPCPANYQPVCGCNGQTYGNTCALAAAKVGIKYYGEC
ncbi:hypothetical protein ACHAWF_016976 [Thalassiosira exigua]